MDLLNTITFVIGVFALVGLGAWASVTSRSNTVAWNRRSTPVAARPAQLTEVGAHR